MSRVGKSYPSHSIKDRLRRAESSRDGLTKRVAQMFDGIELAITYLEDGAPRTALRVLRRTLKGS